MWDELGLRFARIKFVGQKIDSGEKCVYGLWDKVYMDVLIKHPVKYV